MNEKDYKKLAYFIRENIKKFDAVIISDYRKGIITERLVKHINRYAKKYNKFVSVDPKAGNFQCYRGVSLVTPNKKEAADGSGIHISDKKALIEAGGKLLSKLRCKSVLITLGKEGMSLFGKDDIHHIPTVARHVFDVTGAGDTVISAFTLAYISGATMLQSAEISNHAAGIVVGEVGTAATTADEILTSIIKTAVKHPAPGDTKCLPGEE
ncbi:MAG TPA: hypothetical protein ENH38_09555 [Nitrospirae bacterium]|nr:hypothetical protein [Nitrospirota bacterium]